MAGSEKKKKMLFGRGVYGAKDVPIRILNVFIALLFISIVVFAAIFSRGDGYIISYDTDGGSEVASEKRKNGELVTEPETPTKPGYSFVYWVTSEDESLAEVWDFEVDTAEDDQVLYAVWEPAEITVVFDLNGGTWQEADADTVSKQVVFGEGYGYLPEPEMEEYTFDGWYYSGELITAETTVTMTGEHVLTAQWTAD